MRALVIAILLFALSGCMDDDALWNMRKPDYPAFSKGLFVVNEGNFMYDNASLSWYDIAEKEVYNDVFYQTNALPLGDVAISMTIRDSLAYIVVNNSGRIYVVNARTFEYLGKITGLVSPRYMHFVSDTKAYVSDLYARTLTIVNPVTLEVTGTISVNKPGGRFYQHSTEQMVQIGRFLFVNCWSFDDSILVIDTETDEWIETIEVLKQPNSMVADRFGKIWVLTDGGYRGNPFGHEEPALMRIDPAGRQAETVMRFELNDSPRSLAINGSGDTLYFINRHVYRYAVNGEGSLELFASSPYGAAHPGGYYSVGVDPSSSEAYVADAIDLVQPGLVYRFRPDATPVDTFRVGIIPREFRFRP